MRQRLMIIIVLTATVFTGSLLAAAFKEFPVGVYSPDLTDEAMLTVKNSGFNTVLTYHDTEEKFDRLLELAQRHGLKVIFHLQRRLISKPDGVEQMRQTVRKYKNHPALGAWYLFDEPSKDITPEKLRPFYDMLKEETPKIPVTMVICWDETWNRYSNVLDFQMADIYPIRDEKFPDVHLQVFTNFIRESVKLGKPVIPVVQTVSWSSFKKLLQNQGYDHNKFRYPNTAELRYMVFGSMNYGVHGMFAYSYYHAVKTGGQPDWWEKTCTPVFRELKDFITRVNNASEPVIFKRAPDSNQTAAYWSAEDCSGYLILVNEWPMRRKRPKCYLDEYFQDDYELIPWGNTRKVEASIKNNILQVAAPAEPWEVFIWKLKSKNKEYK